MAPRHMPRASQVTYRNARPTRSRTARALALETEEAGDVQCIEVPFYLATRAPKTVRDLMKRKQTLKTGVTGFCVPPGFVGVITYPLSEAENSLLNSMGIADDVQEAAAGEVQEVAAGEVQEVAAGEVQDVAADLLLGAWITSIMLQ